MKNITRTEDNLWVADFDEDATVLASIYAAKIPPGIRNSIRGGTGRIVGALGEVAAFSFLNNMGLNPQFAHTPHYDLRSDFFGTVEVKTKLRTVPGDLRHEGSVTDYNPNQRADYYMFVSIEKTPLVHRAYIMGWIKTGTFYALADYREKGQSINGHFNHTCNNYGLNYMHLKRDFECQYS